MVIVTDILHHRQTEKEQREGDPGYSKEQESIGQEEISDPLREVLLHGYRGVNAILGFSWQSWLFSAQFKSVEQRGDDVYFLAIDKAQLPLENPITCTINDSSNACCEFGDNV